MMSVTVYQEDNNEVFEFNEMVDALAFISTCHECGAVDTSFYIRNKKEGENNDYKA